MIFSVCTMHFNHIHLQYTLSRLKSPGLFSYLSMGARSQYLIYPFETGSLYVAVVVLELQSSLKYTEICLSPLG